ncbi:MAG: hypothetical protein RJA63_3246, partial [Pseudomonadota bacterium]
MSGALERAKWRSRRGLLELDLVFSRFFEAKGDSLSTAELEVLQDLLVTDDHALWAMLNGTAECSKKKWKTMVAMIRSTGMAADAAESKTTEGMTGMTTQKSATLGLNGQSYEFPVASGSVGPDVIDIRSLYAKTGMFTFDPGFMSTASCKSSITYIDGDKGELLYRG